MKGKDQKRLRTIHADLAPEQYFRELADREAGLLEGVMVVLLRKDGSACTGGVGLSDAEQCYAVALLDHDVRGRAFGYRYLEDYCVGEEPE